MKSIAVLFSVILLSASLISCSKVSSNSGACGKEGLYGDQNECQNSVSLGTCASVTVQSGNQNLVCWKSSTTSNQTGNTSTGTGTGTGTGCTGQAPPWTMGAWSPAACTSGVTQRTRVVTCDYPCACNGAQPSATESCTPNMFNGTHYETECTAAGGSLEWIEGNRVCKMAGTACSGNWIQHYYSSTPYTITSAASAQEHTNCTGGRKTVYTGSHGTFSPARAIESLVYCSSRNCFGCTKWSTLKATVGYVACY